MHWSDLTSSSQPPPNSLPLIYSHLLSLSAQPPPNKTSPPPQSPSKSIKYVILLENLQPPESAAATVVKRYAPPNQSNIHMAGYTDPAKPDAPRMHKWHFRSGLDRYIWIVGMIYAYFHPNVEQWMEKLEKCETKKKVTIKTSIVSIPLFVRMKICILYVLVPATMIPLTCVWI
ncbi:hypothetical protein TSUD_110160 [Trifolium subterraneum]|uniref:Uncharacterized protein n=1 Tax=Trifolium subterraneum TaxID=3900 RepID=A0A2Z6M5P0_TRISU|nr:hypothetical protein TSUD_110160 [Trifolium subterraneum]